MLKNPANDQLISSILALRDQAASCFRNLQPYNSSFVDVSPDLNLYGYIYSHLVAYELNLDYDFSDLIEQSLLSFVLNFKELTTASSSHSASYSVLHRLAFTFQALRTTNSNINLSRLKEHPVISSYLSRCLDPWASNIYLSQLTLDNQWHDSNIIMSVFALASEVSPTQRNLQCLFDSIRVRVESTIHQPSGLAMSRSFYKRGLLNGIAATYHYLPLYIYMKQSYPHPSRLLKSALSCISGDSFS